MSCCVLSGGACGCLRISCSATELPRRSSVDSTTSGAFCPCCPTLAPVTDGGHRPLDMSRSNGAISAVTFATRDMARAVRFYEALGFSRKLLLYPPELRGHQGLPSGR